MNRSGGEILRSFRFQKKGTVNGSAIMSALSDPKSRLDTGRKNRRFVTLSGAILEARRGSLILYRITGRRPWSSGARISAIFKGGICSRILRQRYNLAQRFCKV